MKHLIPLLFLAAACGPKTPPATPEPPAPPPVAELPPPPEPPPPAPPTPINNADFRVTITRADGTTETERVIGVERGLDFYGVSGFTSSPNKTTVSLSKSGTSRDAAWSEIQRIDIAYNTTPSSTNCVYDSSTSPWDYICTLPTTTTAVAADGERFDVTTRNVWRLTFANGTTTELYLFKLPVRQADDSGLGMRNTENPEMYVRLREAVLQAAASAPTRIEISP